MKTWMRNAVLKSGLTPHNPSETNPALALFNLNKAISYHNQYKAYVDALLRVQSRIPTQKHPKTGRNIHESVSGSGVKKTGHMQDCRLVSHVSRAHLARSSAQKG